MNVRHGHCRGCRQPVIFAQSEDEGLLVLETHAAAGGDRRYAIWDDGSVHPVTRRASVRAHAVHDCPAQRTRVKLK